MGTLATRRASMFRNGRGAVLPPPIELASQRPADLVGSGTIAEREKSELIERHISAFEATLPAGALSAGDKDLIRSRAMLGPSNASAILTSVMQAVAVIKPAHHNAAVNYYSSAAGPDAKLPDGLGGSGYRAGEAAFLRSLQAAQMSRGSESGLGGLARVSASGFGLSSDGSLSGMSTQFYRQNFQSYYGASPQGQFTASRVAGILGRNEGLSGEALVARTKEVARDTRDRLGLDTNIYAPKVANIGKKYSDPIIENKKNLDEARAAQQRGDTAAAAEHERRFLEQRRRQEERARREDPSKAGDVAGVYNGLIVEAMRNGWKPTDQNAEQIFRSVSQSADPDKQKRLNEILEAAKKSPEGAAMVKKLEPLIEEQQRTAAQRREQEARLAEQQIRETAAAAAAKKEVASEADVFDAPATPTKPDPQKSEVPAQDVPPQRKAEAEQPVAPKGGADTVQAAAAPAKEEQKAQVAAAPVKKPASPTV